MTRSLLLLALITIASAQFSRNFTQVLLVWGTQGVLVVPENITDAAGKTYFDLQEVPATEDGQWRIDLINANGNISSLRNVNNDLVIVGQDNTTQSVSASIPPLLSISGAQLVNAVSNGVQSAVNSVYTNSTPTRLTTTQANTQANTVVSSLLAASNVPPFFLAPFKAQASNQIAKSLANAQRVSAAINATAKGQNNNTAPVNNGTTGNGNAVTETQVPLDLNTFNLNNLNNVKELDVAFGNDLVILSLNKKTEDGENDDAFAVELQTMIGLDEENTEWQLQWIDTEGNPFNLVHQGDELVVKDNDGNINGDFTAQADMWANGENEDAYAAVSHAIEDFVDAAFETANNSTKSVVINAGNNGLTWDANGNSNASNTTQL